MLEDVKPVVGEGGIVQRRHVAEMTWATIGRVNQKPMALVTRLPVIGSGIEPGVPIRIGAGSGSNSSMCWAVCASNRERSDEPSGGGPRVTMPGKPAVRWTAPTVRRSAAGLRRSCGPAR